MDFLARSELIDCQGTTTHTLTLEPDGRVTVRLSDGRTAVVDVATRRNLTPHVPLGDDVLGAAAALTPW